MTSTPKQNMKVRVERSLQQLGYTDVTVTDQGDGQVTLTCIGLDRNDLCVLKAAIQSVVGVSSVKTKTK
ncbi:MAG: hypothetical protein HKN47_27395 [Pirellulaceae bacterium]|nr:hypothetical protein [Pirellulaceae bacterium]